MNWITGWTYPRALRKATQRLALGKLVPLLLLFTLGVAYLYPGSRTLMTGSTSRMLGADGDLRALPYQYDQYHRTFLRHPGHFFYGAVYVEGGADGERGMIAWVPWIERWSVVALRTVLPIEQVATGFVWLMMIANGLSMFALARALLGPNAVVRPIAVALAIGWAFSAYTVVRAQVHPAFVGVFHLPLILLGLTLAARPPRAGNRRTLAAAALCFLASVTVAHYYVVTAAALSPLWLGFFWLRPAVIGRRARALARLALATVPALLFLTWNLTQPLPPSARAFAAEAYPATGDLARGQTTHPYLRIFAARPLDFLAGDLWPGSGDANPLRADVNQAVTDDIALGGRGNAHERTNGVRWSVIFIALLGLLASLRPGSALDRRHLWFFAVLTAVGFWLSLAPPDGAEWLGPSHWLQRAVTQLRVPSRAGILVNFGLLVMTGFALARWTRDRHLGWWAWMFPVLMVIDYPPLVNAPRMTDVPPAIAVLARDNGACGTGLFFPFASPLAAETEYLNFLLLMRGSDCAILNAGRNERRTRWLNAHFAPPAGPIKYLEPDPATTNELLRVARCAPLTWIVFDDRTSAYWRERTCAALGWNLYLNQTCVSPRKGEPLRVEPDAC